MNLRSHRSVPQPPGAVVLLVGIGEWWSVAAFDAAGLLALEHEACVMPAQLLRDWGSGVPIVPPRANEAERARADETIAEARGALAVRGVATMPGVLVPTRSPARAVRRLASDVGAVLAVLDAPPRSGVSDWRWALEPYHVALRAGLPVHLVQPGAPFHAAA